MKRDLPECGREPDEESPAGRVKCVFPLLGRDGLVGPLKCDGGVEGRVKCVFPPLGRDGLEWPLKCDGGVEGRVKCVFPLLGRCELE